MTPLERAIANAAQEMLTTSERAKMRALLSEYIAFKPLRTPTQARGIFIRLARPAMVSGAAIAAFALVSGGVAFAAEGTLPGDTLYPVKVGIIEPIETALTPQSEQAAWQMTLAERRLDEGAALASEGKLATSTASALASAFDAKAAAALEDEASSLPEDASAARIAFAAQLSGYQSVLAQLRAQGATTTESLRAALDERLASLAPPEHVAGVMRFASSTPPTHAYVAALENADADALIVSADLIGEASSTIGTSTSASAKAELSEAEGAAVRGHDLLTAHDDSGASAAFTDSLSVASELGVLTHTATTLKIDTFVASTSASSTVATSTASTTIYMVSPAHPITPPPSSAVVPTHPLPLGL